MLLFLLQPRLAAQNKADLEDVSYEQVLADPDNPDLNYRYTRARVARGDFKGAVAPLERILALYPQRHDIRLFYVLVLYRLDNIQDAERELENLSREPLDEKMKEEVERYKKEISSLRKRNVLSGHLGFGYDYMNNRNFSPSTGRVLFGDTVLFVSGQSLPRDDTSLMTNGHVEFHHDLGTQSGHELFASASFNRTDQTHVKSLSLQVYSLQAGGTFKSRWLDATPTLMFDYLVLHQRAYLRNRGASVKLEKKLTRKASVYLSGTDAYQQFTATPDVQADSADRSGVEAEAAGGGNYWVTPRMMLGAGYGYGFKHSALKYLAFERHSLRGTHTWLLPKSMFLASSLYFNFDHYERPNDLVSTRMRRDHIWWASTTYGTPLSFISSAFKDLIWTVTYDYYQTISNIPNFSYTNNRIATKFSYQWKLAY
ncbi:MAG: tetratricopeptide repeat protein [Elusimicrobia bacterium]|nr:tetratricopeptide repeat protein [Elusimicrobiota bacterium]